MEHKEPLICSVCNAPGKCSSYGATSLCDSCRVFFRRHVLNSNGAELQCRQDERCFLSTSKKKCSYCRFQRCLEARMTPEAVNRNPMMGVTRLLSPDGGRVNVHSISCQQMDSMLWIQKNPGSQNLDVRVLNKSIIPGYSYKVVIEVRVNESTDIIVGTNFSLSEEVTSAFAKELSNSLLFISNTDHVELIRSTDHKEDFPVHIFSLKSHKANIMKSVTITEWNLFTQVLKAWNCFKDIPMTAHTILDDNMKSCIKRILLSRSLDNFTTSITTAIQQIECFNNLPFEDQLILLKEGMEVIGFIMTLMMYHRRGNFFDKPAFNGLISVCVHHNSLNLIPSTKAISSGYALVSRYSHDFLWKDPVFVTLLSVILVLQDREGLSSLEAVQMERRMFTILMAKYVDARTESGDWFTTPTEVWKCVHKFAEHVQEIRSMFIKYANDIESSGFSIFESVYS